MRSMLFLCLLIFATSAISSEIEKRDYANYYADTLVEEFDRQLDEQLAHGFLYNENLHILYSKVYAKLLSARRYIEAFGHADPFEHRIGNSKDKSISNVLMIKDSNAYLKIVHEIDSDAELIYEQRQKEYNKNKSNNLVIYPSVTWDGNVSGNKYPNKVWSLTFDDGPMKGRTHTIVDNLYRNGMKATFFMLVEKVNATLESAQYVKNAGMEVALHSYTHKSLNNVRGTKLDYEITKAKKDLENLLNVDVGLFRLPYGAGLKDQVVRKKIADNKMVHVFWTVDTLDWKDTDPSSIQARALKQMRLAKNGGGIILYHDIQKPTVKASEMMIKYLKDNDYQVCTVGEVVDYKNGLPQDCLK